MHYLGQGRHAGRVSDLAYHNSLMVQIWSMLAARDAGLAAEALGAVPPVPSTTAWITYVRCHDDIGWAIDDADAAAVGVNGFDHRSFLSDFYSGAHPGPSPTGWCSRRNPQTGDRRISGTTASLTGLGRALRHDDGPATDDAVARILLSHALVMGWGGVPVLWSGDEVGRPQRRAAGATSPATTRTTGGRTDPGSTTPRSRPPTPTRARRRDGCSRGCAGSRPSAPACRTCTRRWRPRPCPPRTAACSASSAATRSG